MRRHESRRGAKVTGKADPEGVEPRKFYLDSADGCVPPAGNKRRRANGKQRRYSPGSEAVSSLTRRTRGQAINENQGVGRLMLNKDNK